ncbi:MAG TPA: transposase, partial [Polyangiaceae bacterium]|nr:transposase [Polyangiaceae bacterium]
MSRSQGAASSHLIPFSDGTVAVDMDPLSLLCRLAATVPPPRFHTVRYAGVLSSHARWRPS